MIAGSAAVRFSTWVMGRGLHRLESSGHGADGLLPRSDRLSSPGRARRHADAQSRALARRGDAGAGPGPGSPHLTRMSHVLVAVPTDGGDCPLRDEAAGRVAVGRV